MKTTYTIRQWDRELKTWSDTEIVRTQDIYEAIKAAIIASDDHICQVLADMEPTSLKFFKRDIYI